MSKSLFLSMLIIASLFSFIFAYAEMTEDADYVFAKKAISSGLYDLAGERLESMLRNYPNTPRIYETHSLLGKVYYHQNKLSRALYEFEVVLNAPSGSDSQDGALYWSGEIYLKNGDYKKALELYQRIIDEFSASGYLSYAVYSKGWCYYKLGLLDEAISCFETVVSKYPLEKPASEAQFRIGECKYLIGDYAGAEKEIGKFTEKFPISEKTSNAYYLMGEVNFYLEKYKDAITYFQRALDISPLAMWAAFAEYRMASAFYQAGDYSASIKGYKNCLKRKGDDFLSDAALLGLARNYEKTHSTAEAMKIYDNVITSRIRGDAAQEACYRKANLLLSQNRYEEAGRLCEEAIAKSPGSKYTDDMHYALGLARMGEGENNAAIKEFVRVRNGSLNANLAANAMIKAGDIYLAAGDYKRGIEDYDAVLNRYPDSAVADYAQAQLGDIFLATGKFDQAILAYQSALTNFPETPLREKILFKLAAANFKKGDFEHAFTEFKGMLKAFPSSEMTMDAKLYMADSLYAAGNYNEAFDLYKIIEREASDEGLKAMAAYQEGWSYFNMAKDLQAVGEFNRFLKAYPSNALAADAGFWLGEYYAAKGKYDKAREYYYSIVKDFPSIDLAGKALYRAALTYQDEGRIDESVVKLEELYSKFPDSEFVKSGYRKIAKIKRDNKDYPAAIDYYRKALTLENNEINSQVQYEIAESFENGGDLGRSAEEYMKVPGLYYKGAFWSVRAELKAAQIFEKLNRLNEAKKLYERLAEMDIEESAFANKRLEWIRKEIKGG